MESESIRYHEKHLQKHKICKKSQSFISKSAVIFFIEVIRTDRTGN